MISRNPIQATAFAITRELYLERIILFGSHARGETTPDSDVDQAAKALTGYGVDVPYSSIERPDAAADHAALSNSTTVRLMLRNLLGLSV